MEGFSGCPGEEWRARLEGSNIPLSSRMEAEEEARSRQASGTGRLWDSEPTDELFVWGRDGLGSGRRAPRLELLTRA